MIRPTVLRGSMAAFAMVAISIASLISGCKTQDVASRYSAKYIADNKGKINTQIPEAFELGYTVLALTDLAQSDTSLIDKTTPYYKDLIAYFDKYKHHKAVTALNNTLKQHPDKFRSFRNGLYAFHINQARFALRNNYRIDVNPFGFSRFEQLFQDFYRESHFDKFYASHATYYKQMIQQSNAHMDLATAQKTFNNSQSYHVILSPLMKGQPGIMEIKGTDYSEVVIFPYLTAKGLNYSNKRPLPIKISE